MGVKIWDPQMEGPVRLSWGSSRDPRYHRFPIMCGVEAASPRRIPVPHYCHQPGCGRGGVGLQRGQDWGWAGKGPSGEALRP